MAATGGESQDPMVLALANEAGRWALENGVRRSFMCERPWPSGVDWLVAVYTGNHTVDLFVAKKQYEFIFQYLHPEQPLRNLWVGKKYEDIARLFVKEKKTRKRNRDEMEGSSSNDILEDFADQVLTCPVCYEHIGVVITLSCGHSICQECIEKIRDQKVDEIISQNIRVSCPECRRPGRIIPHFRMTAACEQYWKSKAQGPDGTVSTSRRGEALSSAANIENMTREVSSINNTIQRFEDKFVRNETEQAEFENRMMRRLDDHFERLHLAIMARLGEVHIDAPAPPASLSNGQGLGVLARLRDLIN